MTNDWNKRPLEEFYTTKPKQQVQFPSITVCPSGKYECKNDDTKENI